MLSNEKVNVDGSSLQGIKVELPGAPVLSGVEAPVLMLVGKKGFIGCGYFKTEVADKVSHALAVVSGVSSFEDILAGTVKAVSAPAAGLGITIGMTGAEAAKLLA